MYGDSGYLYQSKDGHMRKYFIFRHNAYDKPMSVPVEVCNMCDVENFLTMSRPEFTITSIEPWIEAPWRLRSLYGQLWAVKGIVFNSKLKVFCAGLVNFQN